MDPTPVQKPGPNPLSQEHMATLNAARRTLRKIRRATRFAGVSGWSTLLFGVLTLPFALANFTALLLGAAFVTCGLCELRGKRSLERLDRAAPGRLAVNQLMLAAAVTVYAGLNVVGGLTGEGAISAAIAQDPSLAGSAEVERMLEPIASLERTIVVAVYLGVGLGAIVMGSGAALFYASRRKHLHRLHEQTPAWALEVLELV